MPRTSSITVKGTVTRLGWLEAEAAIAYVRIRDVTLIDAPSETVAAQAISVAPRKADPVTEVDFSLQFSARPGASYNLDAHISLSGGPDISIGDFLTIESYPVPTDQSVVTINMTARQYKEYEERPPANRA